MFELNIWAAIFNWIPLSKICDLLISNQQHQLNKIYLQNFCGIFNFNDTLNYFLQHIREQIVIQDVRLCGTSLSTLPGYTQKVVIAIFFIVLHPLLR